MPEPANVVVVGGGRMGLPLACVLADNGARVTVCDVRQDLVEDINAGRPPYPEEPGLDEVLVRVHASGNLRASTNTTESVCGAQFVVVIVPAHLTPERDIDYHILEAASAAVAKGLQRGTLVSYETTVAVGGVRAKLVPVLERESGLKAGEDFFVSFSPERVKANQVFAKLRTTPKIVGGFNTASAAKAEAFYCDYLVQDPKKVINVDALEAAEMAKLADMLYRDVNIALANELASYAEAAGVDFNRVRDAANTCDESGLLIPGIGVGGHCTPVYPYFIIRDGERRDCVQRLATAARQINDGQPERNVRRLEEALGPLAGKRVHIMGLAFRPDVKVEIFSSAYDLKQSLQARSAIVTIEDPMYTEDELRAQGFDTATAGSAPMDAVLLNTAHSAWRAPDFAAWRAKGVRAVLDGRSYWKRDAAESAGLIFLAVGDGRAGAR
jgi:nucleotide sugar dehydrogenase